ncbi:MAG: M20/M25/M40 family metallo-hydrolase [Candidatus Aminicenantes bacterium]|nr:M20/M25/M40 family metallo-hydrolase [Candidatus Aminicenantes bacterium]
MRKRALLFVAGLFVLAAVVVSFQKPARMPDDPVVNKIIELGTTDNQVMAWNDYASNRFGGRETGTNAYTDATAWAVWQFKQWGLEAELDEAGEVPVGFNRGPWFGKMIKPAEKALFFGTPSFTAGTKGVQRGPVVILKTDPFSIPGRNATPENIEKKRAAVEAAIAEVKANKSAFKGAWVLIPGENTGFARDGRRGTPEYADAKLIPPLTQLLVEAGALGTIQLSKTEPFRILDGYVESWDKLPVLPDVKLAENQYNEIKALVEKGERVELEFDIRNWFKMGPIKYHSVVATLRGTTFPDECIVIGGHYDCFSGATGAVDDGSGFAPAMEAIRLIKAAGGQPKRSIIVMLFAAEEIGLVGSQAWLKKHPEMHPKILMMINRDGSPSAITGASVPETWYADFQKITAPLTNLNAKWPFKLERGLPRAHATSPGGTDSSSFEMVSVPTLNFRTQSDYVYNHAWHTLYDTYSELVPYTAHQQHSALVTAVVVYGAANLDKPLPREGVYLPDGLYAAFTIGPADAPMQIMTTLDYVNAPLQTANFIRIVEGKTAGTGQRGMGPGPGPAGPPAGVRGAGAPGQPRPEIPPIGTIDVRGGMIKGLVVSDIQKSVALPSLPMTANAALKHDAAGILGVSAPNAFYLTLQKNLGLDKKSTAIGKTIAGLDLLPKVKKGDAIRSIRIVRVGQAARDFKTDDEAFKKLLEPAK